MNNEIQVNDILEISAEMINKSGEGIARYNGKIVYIRDALPNRMMKVKVNTITDNSIYTEAIGMADLK